MGDSIKHYILTRFNVASPGREQAIRLRPGWLDDRLALFRDYCLPSVAAQTRQDFEWVIFFDEQTPDIYKATIAELQAIYPFRAVYTGLFQMDRIVPPLAKADGADWLLTTRLDSDDILAVDHVARLRDTLTPARRQVTNFLEGAILSVTDGTPRLYLTKDDSNPFASRMEPAGPEARSIWGERHTDIARMAPIQQVETGPAWLQIVHGANVSNRIKGRRVPLDLLSRSFPFLAQLARETKETNGDIQRENHIIAPLRSLNEALRKAAKLVYYSVIKA